ncbi:hypothetical protein NOK12_07370 [Nocardioides sp. OK12]|uniref:pentapeptide repeat-containing protein n=1 Tax=Nocardioides sp. OK12 TaxID=2758661 RepID=UPI0021C3517C|nr:pentapeptide repeat-containing protein [Nocardioides sp. OK12]GHJ58218.1 hypothetical protein NOK12_07370 [Nocardioides sp. OK12]
MSARIKRAHSTVSYWQTLKARQPEAVSSAVVWVVGIVLLVVGITRLAHEEQALLLVGPAVFLLEVSTTWRNRIRFGGPQPADVLRLVTHTTFWLTLLAGMIILASGHVPFLGERLATTPGQNVATDLGNALLGGLIVSAVLIVMQLAQQRRDEHSASELRRQSERSTMLLILGLERDLSRVDLSDLDLSWFSLRGRDLSGSRSRRCCLFRSNLEQCDFTKGELNDADLTNAFLRGAVLRGAHLHRATLDHARMQEVDLVDAELFGVSAVGASFRNANLRGADLRSADLRDADLQHADLRNAAHDRRTLFPAGFDPAKAGMVRDDEVPRSDMLTPTGNAVCGADHEADRRAWARQQAVAAAEFERRLEDRVAGS